MWNVNYDDKMLSVITNTSFISTMWNVNLADRPTISPCKIRFISTMWNVNCRVSADFSITSFVLSQLCGM